MLRHYRVDLSGLWWKVDCHSEGCEHGGAAEIIERPDGSVEYRFLDPPARHPVLLPQPLRSSFGWLT